MKKIKLEISNITTSQNQNGAYALVLAESGGNRRLPIIIGGFEAQAIAIELEKMSPARPLTHDLFKLFAEAFMITVSEVIIYNLNQGVFFSKLICKMNGANDVEVDARTSDAIALALRFNCPIYTYEFILNSAGIMIDEEPETENALNSPFEEDAVIPASASDELSKLSKEELKELLRVAIEDEAYERAGKIRDELAKRQ